MVALSSTSPTSATLPTPAPTLPPPLQPRIPRAPIRIIVLCDGTAQQRNWVKTSINTATKTGAHAFHHSSTHNDATTAATSNDRGDQGDKRKRKGGSSNPAAETGDFFTNVALLAKVIAQSSGVASTSPVQSPKLGSTGAHAGDQFDPTKASNGGVMPQVVFYQSGIGTGTGKIRNLVDQGTGLSLGSKIEEAYSFIVDNYQPGDELFLFGFSRGAYTARCISGLINWCGVLTKVEMTHFADIWAAYQRRDPDDISSEVDAAETLYSATLKYPSAESEQLATSMYLYNLKNNSKLSDARKAELEGLRLLASIIDRRREWGKQLPHRSRPTINYQHARTVLQRKWDSETMKRTVWANMALTGRTDESIHPSVIRGGRIRPDTHPALADLWKDTEGGGREMLQRMWKQAEDWAGTLRPTEKLLYWDKRGPYPWISGQGDAALNPLISPLIITGGWNIPELAGREAQKLVISAAQEGAKVYGMGDVDEGIEQHLTNVNGAANGSSGAAGKAADVDDQAVDGWGDVTATDPIIKPKDAAPTSSSSSPSPPPTTLTTLAPPTTLSSPPPTASYPLIPSKELGENPVDPTTHPHLYSLFSTLYSLSSTPNTIVADILNLRLVPKTNLNQTMVQGWLWDLSDKWAGYSDEVKVQALTAGLGLHKKGRSAKGKKLKKGETKTKGSEDSAKASHDE
ncbi:hypothetical protein NDA16_002384 [Ustilago loliicola]|nr:hypothetical protein NDA16_002384 [Ustilago loliicola]